MWPPTAIGISASIRATNTTTLIRECCIDDARKYKALTLRNAITDQHPAYRLFLAAWNSLTDAERWQVGDIVPVYDHGPAGFAEREMQGELFL